MRFFVLLCLLLLIVAMASSHTATTEQERAEQLAKLADYQAQNARTSQLMASLLTHEFAEKREDQVDQLPTVIGRTENEALLPKTELVELVTIVKDKVDNQQADIEKLSIAMGSVSTPTNWTGRGWASLLFALGGIGYAFYHYQKFSSLRAQYERVS